ncbi:MAG: hypothetical protein KJZ60_05285, partial [Ignavibacteriaceae bacterium]|nr:hypothetical protein [Ignavibacteriaceae bacterium]
MKKYKYIIIVIILLSTFANIICQQEPRPETKAYILDKLQNGDYYHRSAVIGDATNMYIIPEVVPILEQTLHQQGRTLAYRYLRALAKYNSPNFTSLAHWFINSVDTLQVENVSFETALEMKVYVTDKLMDRGDFSTVQYVFDLVEEKKPETFIGAANMLNKIIENVPQWEAELKAELIRLTYLNDYFESYDAIYSLTKYYSSETIPILVFVFANSPYRPEKALALDSLIKYGYPEIEGLMRIRLIPDSSMTTAIAERLLEYYPSPYNYKFISNNFDQISISRKLTINFLLQGFTPSPPDTLMSKSDMIEDLISLIDTVYNYTWLGDLTFSNELKNILTTAKTNLQNGDSLACRVQVKTFQDLVDNVYKDSLNSDPRFVTIEGWKFLYWNAQYILDRLPEPQANPNLLVNLKNSLGNQIPASNVMYYESATSGWKDAVNNGDGTFTVITTKPTVSVRMFYEYANQTVHNVTAQNNTYTFITVNAAVELRNSSGNLMPAPSGDQGTVQYYADAWRTFGTTSNGVAYKELLPINYSFRMTYEYVPNDKQQDISVNSTVTFATVLCTLKVTNFNNQPLAGASTKYYSTAWRDIGLTNSEGIITKELLPKNLSFRAT